MAAPVSVRSRATTRFLAAALVLSLAAASACGTATSDLPARSQLSPPQNLSIATNGLSVTISWDPVGGASSYVVYWREGATVTLQSGTTARASGSPYVHQAQEFGVTYAYLVVAVDASGHEGRPSPVVTVTPTSQALAAPQNVRATAGDGMVTLAWDRVPGATGYTIEGVSPFGPFALADHSVPPAVHRPVVNKTEYRYRVRAKFGLDVGPWSAPPVAAIPMPTAPGTPVFTDVRALIQSDPDNPAVVTGGILLSWSEAQHATEYQVYLRTVPDPSGPEVPLIVAPAPALTQTSYLHAAASYGVPYWFRVEAINDGVVSPGNDLVTHRVRASVPAPLDPGAAYTYVIRAFDGAAESTDTPVTSVEPSDASRARDLSWTPPSAVGATWQRLYRAAPPSSAFDLIAAFPDLAVSSYRDAGISPSPVPTGLEVAPQGSSLLVTWSPLIAAAEGYRLYWWEQAPGGATAMGLELVFPTEYRHEGVSPGSVYTYAVQAVGFPGVSPASSATAP
jgi:hypothetical protein